MSRNSTVRCSRIAADVRGGIARRQCLDVECQGPGVEPSPRRRNLGLRLAAGGDELMWETALRTDGRADLAVELLEDLVGVAQPKRPERDDRLLLGARAIAPDRVEVGRRRAHGRLPGGEHEHDGRGCQQHVTTTQRW